MMSITRLVDRDWLAVTALLSVFVTGWGWILRGQLRGLLVMAVRVPFVLVMLSSLAMLGESMWGDTCVGSDTYDQDCVRTAERWFGFGFASATAIPLISAAFLWRSQCDAY